MGEPAQNSLTGAILWKACSMPKLSPRCVASFVRLARSRLAHGAGAASFALALIFVAPAAWSAAGMPSSNVAWQAAGNDSDIDRLFSQASREKKPLLLYWGATWCPPCNQLKATFFNRQDFAVLAQSFVAVSVDGDLPGAQKLGARFKVRGYPTVILMTAQGAEITRLPGEVDAPQIMAALQAGLSGGRPIKAVLADARAGKSLTPLEWRMLAFYSWETDEATLVSEAQRAALLAELAGKSPAGDGETTMRLWLKALAASDDGKGLKPDAELRARVQRVLADPALARMHSDVLKGGADDMVKVLSIEGSPERAALTAQFDGVLQRLQSDTTLSRGDRVEALYARVALARIGLPKAETAPKLPAKLLADVKDMAARMDREITDGYEREAVISTVAYLQGEAGLWADSDALLKANLARSHSPYYLMSQLAGNARKLGQKEEALRWYEQAFDKSVGPATRLQWGATYLGALVDLAPADAPRIEKAAAQLFKEAAADKSAFYERSARSLKRVGNKLQAWNSDGRQSAVLNRLQKRLDETCKQVAAADGRRAACESLLRAQSPV
jgi:thioredoxin-related protein